MHHIANSWTGRASCSPPQAVTHERTYKEKRTSEVSGKRSTQSRIRPGPIRLSVTAMNGNVYDSPWPVPGQGIPVITSKNQELLVTWQSHHDIKLSVRPYAAAIIDAHPSINFSYMQNVLGRIQYSAEHLPETCPRSKSFRSLEVK